MLPKKGTAACNKSNLTGAAVRPRRRLALPLLVVLVATTAELPNIAHKTSKKNPPTGVAVRSGCRLPLPLLANPVAPAEPVQIVH